MRVGREQFARSDPNARSLRHGPDDGLVVGSVQLDSTCGFRERLAINQLIPQVFLDDVLPSTLILFELEWRRMIHRKVRSMVRDYREVCRLRFEARNGSPTEYTPAFAEDGNVRVQVKLDLHFGEDVVHPFRLDADFPGVFLPGCLPLSVGIFEEHWWQRVHLPIRVLIRDYRKTRRERATARDPLLGQRPNDDDHVWRKPRRDGCDHPHDVWERWKRENASPLPLSLPW